MTTDIERVILIVLDSVGIGYLPDAAEYGDVGANTLVHLADARGGLNLANLQRLGLANIIPVPGLAPVPTPLASFGRMMPASKGKDTMTGHWELMGLVTEKPFALFPHGFGPGITAAFLEKSGAAGILGDKAASGTVIIQELGEEHMRTGFPIVYTSADSVFQVAAHEQVIPLPELYRMCEQAREVCDAHMIGRVIARPFVGERSGEFKRTANRRDFPMKPPEETALDIMKRENLPVVGLGKIEDIYAGCGITRAIHSKDNADGMKYLSEELAITRKGLLFINLVDFDMLYGHRNDVAGYSEALEDFDTWLAGFLPKLGADDLLIITADHGCDPTHPGTDHTREYVPLLLYSQSLPAKDLGTRKTFADVGVTILDLSAIPHSFVGTNLLECNYPVFGKDRGEPESPRFATDEGPTGCARRNGSPRR